MKNEYKVKEVYSRDFTWIVIGLVTALVVICGYLLFTNKAQATGFHTKWGNWSEWQYGECSAPELSCGQSQGETTATRYRECKLAEGWGAFLCKLGDKDYQRKTIECTADFGQCEEEGQCPTECGLESSEVADGQGGYKSCEATPLCEIIEDEPTPESTPSHKENTFHKDDRCLDRTPELPTWAYRFWINGEYLANWSAEGGSKVDIEVTNGDGEYEYQYHGLTNDGHEILPNVAMSQVFRVRTVNGCVVGPWLVDPIDASLRPFIVN